MKPIRCVRLLLVSACLSAGGLRATDWPLPAAEPSVVGLSPAALDRLHANLDALVAADRYAGYVVLVARDGKVADWHAGGWRDARNRTPMQTDSIVRIFSMTKIVTTVAVLMLVEDGRLRLADPVERHLPELKDRQVFAGGTVDAPSTIPAVRPPTIHDLLTHTAGYYYDADWSVDSPVLVDLERRLQLWKSPDLDEFVRRVAQLPLAEQPGTRFRYGINIDLLGAIVQRVAGQRLDRFCQERIFDPLGMRDTGFWVPAEKRGRLALVHQRAPGGGLAVLADTGLLPPEDPGPDRGLLSGGGGLYSTAADYARFAQMLLARGELDGRRLLSRKTVELMTANHIAHLTDPHPFKSPWLGFGLGVRLVTDLGRSPTLGSPGMFGWDGAATTLVWMDPKERMVSILLVQHFPYNEDDVFAVFTNGVYSALAD